MLLKAISGLLEHLLSSNVPAGSSGQKNDVFGNRDMFESSVDDRFFPTENGTFGKNDFYRTNAEAAVDFAGILTNAPSPGSSYIHNEE